MTPGVRTDRIQGCLLGGAVGDALGAPIEFLSLEQIRSVYGPDGLSDLVPAFGRRGAITDDTQMTLFTAEGLIRANVRGRSKGIAHAPSVVQHAYLRWLHTQGWPWPQTGAPFCSGTAPDGWLVTIPALYSRRAPGDTCLTALAEFAAGAPLGSPAQPPNDSKGCGAVMRAAPAGLCAVDAGSAFDLGCEIAALTHGHPSGYLPAGVLAATVRAVLDGATLPAALDQATVLLRSKPGSGETLLALGAARQFSRLRPPTPEELEQLGQGWTGEECLAISVSAALAATDFEHGLALAVNHGGDSDSTGAVCGNLLGAARGVAAIPAQWLSDLELVDVITQVADDLAKEFGPEQPRQEWGVATPEWFHRYPGG